MPKQEGFFVGWRLAWCNICSVRPKANTCLTSSAIWKAVKPEPAAILIARSNWQQLSISAVIKLEMTCKGLTCGMDQAIDIIGIEAAELLLHLLMCALFYHLTNAGSSLVYHLGIAPSSSFCSSVPSSSNLVIRGPLKDSLDFIQAFW